MNSENLRRGLSRREVETLRQDAWLGDAVLELYARKRVLEDTAHRDLARKVSFVRNSFLNLVGQPTRVEAEIGKRYREHGLDAAVAWIAETLQPLFLPQEAKQSSGAKRSRKA